MGDIIYAVPLRTIFQKKKNPVDRDLGQCYIVWILNC